MFSWFTPSGAQRPDSAFDNYRTLFFAGFIHPELQHRLAARSRNNSEKRTRKESEAEEDSALEAIVLDFFEPYGTIDFFHFDASLGAGVVRYESGKSGENCFLMSHLLPFRVEKKKLEQPQDKQTRKRKPALAIAGAVAAAAKKETEEQENNFPIAHGSAAAQKEDNNNDNDNDDDDEAMMDSSTPFSLICLEFACLLPFGRSNPVLAHSPLPWVCNRKSLHDLEDYYHYAHDDHDDGSSSDKKNTPPTWKRHLDFMASQRQQRHAFAESVSKLRDALLSTKSSSSSSFSSSLPTIRINGDVASLVQAEIESHLASLVVESAAAAAAAAGMNPKSDFWTAALVPHCLDKIIDQICDIDTDGARIVVGSNSVSAREELARSIIRPVVHSALSVLDVWHALYDSFYSGSDAARTQHNSAVAVLEHRLSQQSSSSSSTSSSCGLRHPAWASFNLKFPTEESKRRSNASPALARRSELGKLFQTSSYSHNNDLDNNKLHPVHLGLKEWPGGASDDAGSSLRAVAAMLCAIRPLYQDTTLRHMWCSTMISNSGKKTAVAVAAAKPFFLERLAEIEPSLKKSFYSVSSGDSIIDGAWALLYRGQWRMESTFGLIASYLKEAPAPVEVAAAAAAAGRSVKKSKNNKKGKEDDDENKADQKQQEEVVDLVATLQAVDTQPVLWPLMRPVDPAEVDWARSGGVFCDAAGVYERLFDNSTSSSSSSSERRKAIAQKQQQHQDSLLQQVWSALCESVSKSLLMTLGVALSLFGQDPSLVSSRHYRRQVVRALGSLLVPVLWATALAVLIFFALRAGHVAKAQVVLYNLLTTLSLDGDGDWEAWGKSALPSLN